MIICFGYIKPAVPLRDDIVSRAKLMFPPNQEIDVGMAASRGGDFQHSSKQGKRYFRIEDPAIETSPGCLLFSDSGKGVALPCLGLFLSHRVCFLSKHETAVLWCSLSTLYRKHGKRKSA